jgi:beta-glucosidase
MKSKHTQFTAPGPEVEARIDALLKQMTLEEKILLLGGQKDRATGDTYGIARLGIPPLKVSDASSGVHMWGPTSTSYPALIALAASWDSDLAYRMGTSIGRDCRARGIHILLGPAVNIYRSALCGRNFEYMGEDPHLAAESSTAYIRGLQDQGVSGTIKHYALNYADFDRNNISSDVDGRTLREIYLPAFRAAVEEAGVGSVMNAYNLLNGVHCSEHAELLRDILKGEWGFDGVLMSDWGSTYSAVNAANAGLDLEMPFGLWLNAEKLLPAIRDGRVTEATIDDKVRRLLRLMICFGWIDHPQDDPSIPAQDPASAAVSLEIARRGCVLLKNEGNLLPLDPKGSGKIAVIGPWAAQTPVLASGSGYNKPWRTVNILDGLIETFGADRIVHCPGVRPENTEDKSDAKRYFTPDGQPGLRAEYFNNLNWAGQPALVRTEPRLEQRWAEGAIAEGVNRECFTARWTGVIRPERTGPHIFYQWFLGHFTVRVAGKVLFDVMNGASISPPSAFLELEAGKDYPIEVLYRRTFNSNGLALRWEYRNLAEEREEALTAARGAEVVIFCGGHSNWSEGEGFDRTFAMPPAQEDLLQALSQAHPKVIAVITAGGNIDMRGWIDRVPALLYAWYPGQEGGTAIAELLSGKVNPSGKLPATFERCLEERSSFHCYHDSDGDKHVEIADGIFTGYRHHDRNGVPPRFPFGFGLSYTTFAYENLRLDPVMKRKGTLKVRFDVVNTGPRAGTEVAQLYLADAEASVPRPVKELKGFATVTLKPGQRKTVTLTMKPRHLEFFDLDRRQWVAEPGEFVVSVGASAADIRLTGSFRYEGMEIHA